MHDPVHGPQQAFRALLDAMARPGALVDLPADCVDGIVPPRDTQGQPIAVGLVALLLTVLDRETSVRLHGELGSEACAQYLRFHTGVPVAEPAAFEVVRAHRVDVGLWQGFELGADVRLQYAATVIL